jgi:hypothetical protein
MRLLILFMCGNWSQNQEFWKQKIKTGIEGEPEFNQQ